MFVYMYMHMHICHNAYMYMYMHVLYRSSVLTEPVDDVLMQLITRFETFLKNQKTESDLISKYSDTSLKKVLQDTATQSQVQLQDE